jgi:hypothetical protein
MKEEVEKHHVLAFGRMNPITSGHEAVVNKLHSVAKEHNASHSLVVSHSQDAKKNPLTGEQKVAHAKNAFPGTNVSSASKEAPTILHHAAAAHAAGATHLHVVAGSDRHEEMHNLLHKYNGKDSGHGHYNFKKITVHSSGERDPDAEGTTGISASKMREHAAAGNKKEFHKGAPSKMKPEHKDAMYNDVRKGMNLKEETMDQQADRKMQLKRFKDQMTQANGPQIDTEIALDKKEKDAMLGKIKVKNSPVGLSKEDKAALHDVNETLRPEMGADTYIRDFIASTNPKFNNKSKEERRKMAIGAYMAAKARGVKEEVEQVEEGYYEKPASAYRRKGDEIGGGSSKNDVPFDGPYTSSFKKPNKNRTGMDSARSLAQRAMDKVNTKKPVNEAKDKKEYGYEGDMALNQLATLTRCAEMIKDTLKPDTDLPEWVQSKITLATDYIQTAADYLYSEAEVNEQAPVPDRKYIKGTPEHKAYKATKKPINGMPTGQYQKEEVAIEEGTFKYHMDKAVAAHTKGDSKKALYHLGNAKTARYAMKTSDYSKNKDLFDKYKQMSEEVELEEARGLADKYYSIAQDRKETADENKGNHETYHTHMGDYHDHMSRYHEELGQHSHAQAHADKADIHHEKSMQRTKTVKEATLQGNVGGGDAMNTTTSAPSASTTKTSTATKKIKGFKFFNGAAEQMKESALETFRAQAAAREKKHDEIEAKRKKAAEEGKENMSSAIDALSKQVKEGWHEKPASAYRRPADHHYQVTYYDKSGKAGDSSKRFAEKEKAEAHADKGNAIDKVGGSYRVHRVGSPIDEASTSQKGVNVDNVNAAGQEPHEEKWEPAKKKVTKIKKEETMKSYKEFLQSLDEKLIGKQKKLDKNHNNKLDSEDFAMLRKEEHIDEVKMSDLPSRKIQGKSYGADYVDPEGADNADDKKPAKAAGRKTGQSIGTYKRRQPKAAC